MFHDSRENIIRFVPESVAALKGVRHWKICLVSVHPKGRRAKDHLARGVVDAAVLEPPERRSDALELRLAKQDGDAAECVLSR